MASSGRDIINDYSIYQWIREPNLLTVNLSNEISQEDIVPIDSHIEVRIVIL
jgi:hypothetical protein